MSIVIPLDPAALDPIKLGKHIAAPLEVRRLPHARLLWLNERWLIDAGIVFAGAPRAVSDEFAGKTFVFTGTLTRFSREEAEGEVKKRGGKAASTGSKQTSYVVAGEKAGSKLDKAQKLGVTVIDEDAFLKMIGR